MGTELEKVDSKRASSVLLDNLAALSKPENIQKYILGTKSSGYPRALYDIIKDYTKPKKKGEKKGGGGSSYSLYLMAKGKKGKKKHKKGKKNKHWHI